MRIVKKYLIFLLMFILVLPFFYSGEIAKAADAKPVQIYGSTSSKDSQYKVTLKWNRVPENASIVDPERGFIFYHIYRDNEDIAQIQDTIINKLEFTDTLTAAQIETPHSYYVQVVISAPQLVSPNSNIFTVKKSDFTNPPEEPPEEPPVPGEITPPRLVGSISDKAVSLRWDKTTFSGCDPDSGSIMYKIYRDDNEISGTQTTSYTDTLTEALAATTHKYYVTTFCSRISGGISGKESAHSNTIQYNPGNGTNPPSVENPDGVIYTDDDINPPDTEGKDTCTPKCKGKKIFWVMPTIESAICSMQCAIINWESEIIVYVINNLLRPALGLGSK